MATKADDVKLSLVIEGSPTGIYDYEPTHSVIKEHLEAYFRSRGLSVTMIEPKGRGGTVAVPALGIIIRLLMLSKSLITHLGAVNKDRRRVQVSEYLRWCIGLRFNLFSTTDEGWSGTQKHILQVLELSRSCESQVRACFGEDFFISASVETFDGSRTCVSIVSVQPGAFERLDLGIAWKNLRKREGSYISILPRRWRRSVKYKVGQTSLVTQMSPVSQE